MARRAPLREAMALDLISVPARVPRTPVPLSQFRPSSRGRTYLLGMTVLVGALMILSALSTASAVGGRPAGSALTPSATASVLAGVSHSSSLSTRPGPAGQTSAGEPYFNAIPYAHTFSKYPKLLAAANAKIDASSTMSSVGAAGAPATSSLGTAAVPPASPTVNYGYVVGRVVASKAPNPALSGAVVSAEPVTGFCPSVGCNPVATAANGSFKVAAAVGENELYISDAYYMTNRTWTYVTPGAIVSVGTIELVEDGFVTGFVRADDPAQEPLGGINITAETRDATFVATPSDHSQSDGAFTVAVPAVPSIITFSPIFVYSPYSSNNTFINVTSGTTLNVGTVFLEKATTVSLQIVNSITGKAISGTATAITVCSKATGACDAQGSASGGPTVVAAAPVGPDSVNVEALGFVNNQTSLGVVPATPAGSSPVQMGVVDMVPIGGILTEVDLTGIPDPNNPSSPASVWGVGEAVVSACSLDGISSSVLTITGNLSSTTCSGGCTPIESPFEFGALPLRNEISVSPDTAGSCSPFGPTWPVAPFLPAFPNTGWANVTPNELVDAGSINLLPGTYIEGQVLPKTVGDWSVSACSTDEPALCGQTVYNDSGAATSNNPAPLDCPQPPSSVASYTFCVPAPPGPVKIDVVSTSSSQNYTWAEVPYLQWAQMPLLMSAASDPSVSSINLTSSEVSGRVLQAESLTPVIGLPGVEVCPAGAASSAAVCGAGVANTEGFFNVSAPAGWDQVKVSAPQYVENSTWVYVVRDNSSGTILLTPYGYITGQVTDPEGNGIYEATVSSCPVTNPSSCSAIGADGTTSTNGKYFGALLAGGIPLGAYQVKAEAPGYTSDWTWVNVTTPGENFTVPTIVLTPLQPIGGAVPAAASRAGPEAAPRAATGSAATGSWVSGRVVDAKYHIGLPTASLTAVPTNGAPPTILSTVRGTGGEFNDSLPTGSYTLEVALTGYYTTNLFINVTGGLDNFYVGLITLVPYPTITGRLVIDPVSWREGVTFAMGLGPDGANVQVCESGGFPCGTAPVDSSGGFNVSAPAGFYDLVLTSTTGTGPGTYPGGFVSNRSQVNVTNASGLMSPPILMGLAVYGTITGSVVHNVSTGFAPVSYDQISFDTSFPVDSTGGMGLNATGGFTMYFPESRGLNITVGGLGAWVPESVGITVNGTSQGGNESYELEPGGVADLGSQFHLAHFGWVDMQIRNAATGKSVPYATLAVDSVGTLWNLPNQMTATGVANGGGFINLTAPPSFKTNDSANLSAPDYLFHLFTVWVNSSQTSVVNTSGTAHAFSIQPWGWINGLVTDALTGAGLNAVSATVTGGGLQSGRLGITTNGLGEYLSDAPLGPTDSLGLTLPGFSSNTTHYNVTAGAWINAPTVHLTGDGIVEGQVLELPGGLPVSGATVQVCPTVQLSCPNTVETNATGIFTMVAKPGLDAIEIAANGFVTNAPAYVTVASEEWYWVGAIDLYEYAYVAGTALGLPGGIPLGDANASLCAPSLSGVGAGPCFTTVLTGFDGSFYLSAPAGTYVLQLNDTFYNDSYLPVSLAPGVTLPVGTIFLQEFGTATGLVDSSATDAPIGSAVVDACEDWGAHLCGRPTAAGPDGRYAVSGPPGPYVLQASAPGFQSAYLSAQFTSGMTTAVTAFLLIAIGPGNLFAVSGTVFSAGASATPLGGAIVTATGGSATYVFQNGTFSLPLYWGTYVLNASLAGYVTQSVTITVQGTLSGVDFALPVMTYAVNGIVRDGLTGDTLSGVQIWEGTVQVGAATAGGGGYSLQLSNGTHDLLAVPSDPSAYASVPFVITVTGAPVTRDLDLFPPTTAVDGTVASSLSGQAIAGATVTISGRTSENVPWTATETTDANGRFAVAAFPGSYMVSASLSGYAPTNVSLTVTAGTSSIPLALALSPISSAGTSSPSSLGTWELVATFLVVVVLAGGLLYWIRRPPARGGSSSRSRGARPPPGGSG